MQPQTVDPTTDATHVSLYSKLVTSIPQLFFRAINNATPVQLTYGSIGIDIEEAQQYTFMAGPFVFYAGYLPSTTQLQVVALSPTTTLLYVGVTAANTTSTPLSTASQATRLNLPPGSFSVLHPSYSTLSVYYVAIGKP
jgi:hypothetical protein